MCQSGRFNGRRFIDTASSTVAGSALNGAAGDS